MSIKVTTKNHSIQYLQCQMPLIASLLHIMRSKTTSYNIILNKHTFNVIIHKQNSQIYDTAENKTTTY